MCYIYTVPQKQKQIAAINAWYELKYLHSSVQLKYRNWNIETDSPSSISSVVIIPLVFTSILGPPHMQFYTVSFPQGKYMHIAKYVSQRKQRQSTLPMTR